MDMKRFKDLQFENAELCTKKNRAYGDKNLTRFGARGVVVRMFDKAERLANLLWNEAENQVTDEDAWKTAQDLANYGVILQMLIDGTFDKEVGPRPAKISKTSGATKP